MGGDALVVLSAWQSLGRAQLMLGKQRHNPPTGPLLWDPRVAGLVLHSVTGAARALPTGKGESSVADMSNPQIQI